MDFIIPFVSSKLGQVNFLYQIRSERLWPYQPVFHELCDNNFYFLWTYLLNCRHCHTDFLHFGTDKFSNNRREMSLSNTLSDSSLCRLWKFRFLILRSFQTSDDDLIHRSITFETAPIPFPYKTSFDNLMLLLSQCSKNNNIIRIDIVFSTVYTALIIHF